MQPPSSFHPSLPPPLPPSFPSPPEMTILSTDTIRTNVAQREPKAWATLSHTASSSPMVLSKCLSMPFLLAMAMVLERPSMSLYRSFPVGGREGGGEGKGRGRVRRDLERLTNHTSFPLVGRKRQTKAGRQRGKEEIMEGEREGSKEPLIPSEGRRKGGTCPPSGCTRPCTVFPLITSPTPTPVPTVM